MREVARGAEGAFDVKRGSCFREGCEVGECGCGGAGEGAEDEGYGVGRGGGDGEGVVEEVVERKSGCCMRCGGRGEGEVDVLARGGGKTCVFGGWDWDGEFDEGGVRDGGDGCEAGGGVEFSTDYVEDEDCEGFDDVDAEVGGVEEEKGEDRDAD